MTSVIEGGNNFSGLWAIISLLTSDRNSLSQLTLVHVPSVNVVLLRNTGGTCNKKNASPLPRIAHLQLFEAEAANSFPSQLLSQHSMVVENQLIQLL